jgi:MFS family permease
VILYRKNTGVRENDATTMHQARGAIIPLVGAEIGLDPQQVRRTPTPAFYSCIFPYSHRNVWANFHLFGQPNTSPPTLQLGALVGLAATAEMCLFLPAGWGYDALGRKATSIPGMAFMAAGFLVLGSAASTRALAAASVLIGVGNGLTSGLVQLLAQDLAPPPPDAAPFIGLWPPSRFGPPETVLGAPEIFTTVDPYVKYFFIGPGSIDEWDPES